MTRALIFAPLLFAVGCVGFKDDSDLNSLDSKLSASNVSYEPGNPTCQDLGYTYGFKVENPVTDGTWKTVSIDGLNDLTYRMTTNGFVLDWKSPTLPLDAVILKAANGAYVYRYSPEATHDEGLQTPHTQNNDQNAPQAFVSHFDVCFDYEVVVHKTASTSFTRDHAWTIQKTASVSDVVLSLNQVFSEVFTVVVSAAGYTDSNWAVGGTITVFNPDPTNDAKLTSVTDNLSGFGAIAVDCGEVTFPYTLAHGATLSCTYASALPNGDARTNTATATAEESSKVGSGSDTVDVVFSTSGSTVTTVDGCVDVTDTLVDQSGGTTTVSLGQVCAADGSKTFTYSVPVVSSTCGPSSMTNTATYTGGSETGSSTATVNVNIPCDVGCTLTQGYWKTHSSFGPAPYDQDGWAGHENDTFFLSGQTAYQVLWTNPAGNAYYVLAHQYIAAERNVANGASATVIQSALDAAKALFQAYTPAQVKAMKGSSAVRQQFISLAYQLDSYNTGATGPGHCSE